MLFLFLIIIFSVSIFLIGFIQLRMSVGQQSLVYTKTHGWHREVIRHGEMTWMWQALLPTNLTLIRFHDVPSTSNVHFQMTLPGWEVYNDGLPRSAFELSFYGLIEYAFLEDHYWTVFERFFRPEDESTELTAEATIRSAHGNINQQIQAIVSQIAEEVVSRVINQPNASLDSVFEFRQSLIQELTNSLSQIPGINILSIGISNVIVPDFELYTQQRTTFLMNRAELSNRLTELEIALASANRIDDARFSMLRTYGEILTNFPGLLEYFRILGEIGSDPLNLGNSLNN
jgi:hypothetical protein